jgi:RNA polymerase sigma factor (TIGR02999 family)
MSDVTRILDAIQHGDPQASGQLLPLVYDELRKLASQKMAAEKSGQTLQATALVHEAYLRLTDVNVVQTWDSRGHFFAAAAEAMRRILVENARKKATAKHGGCVIRHQIDPDALAFTDRSDVDLIELSDAIERLTLVDSQAAQVVKLRYFAGLTIPETAEILGVSPRTVDSCWAYAKAWLLNELSSAAD